MGAPKPTLGFTSRTEAVLALRADGCTTRQIAERIGISEQTVTALEHSSGRAKQRPTNRLTPPKTGTDDHKSWSAVHRASPGPDRWKFRSRTFEGVAEAAADQWGGYAMEDAA